jgi:hypothetical protein
MPKRGDLRAIRHAARDARHSLDASTSRGARRSPAPPRPPSRGLREQPAPKSGHPHRTGPKPTWGRRTLSHRPTPSSGSRLATRATLETAHPRLSRSGPPPLRRYPATDRATRRGRSSSPPCLGRRCRCSSADRPLRRRPCRWTARPIVDETCSHPSGDRTECNCVPVLVARRTVRPVARYGTGSWRRELANSRMFTNNCPCSMASSSA